MRPLTEEEKNDFLNNQISPDGASRALYDDYRTAGLDHKSALRKTIDDVLNLKSTDLSEDQLARLKNAILKIPGQWF
jgi:hypothetical protein